MNEPQRIAAYEKPSLDEVVAIWLARRFLDADNPVEVVFFPRSSPLRWEENTAWCIEPSLVAPLALRWNSDRQSFQDRYAGSATGRLWVHLLDAGRPVPHLVDLVDAVHAATLDDGKAPAGAVWARLWRQLRTTWKRTVARATDDQTLCQSLHDWLEKYEGGLGLSAVEPRDRVAAQRNSCQKSELRFSHVPRVRQM